MSVAPAGLSAIGTFEKLRDAFFRYYDTPFGLSDRQLQNERRALFDRDGGIYRRPMIEMRPQYVTAPHDLTESVGHAGAPAELADFAGGSLIPEGRPLYEHQEQALRLGMQRGSNIVLTAGTGSGKTESFLLPILASLLEESAGWGGGRAPQQPWWEADDAAFIPQRQGETGRTAAVRAIVMYPMNALVDDQLVRLRQALDSDTVRAWLDQNRRGHRFYFGRFTGTTPVTGASTDNLALRELRRYLRDVAKRSARAQQLDSHVPYFVPRLDGAEMRSRWDMIDTPPDILITNYSMLNVMLLRERDGHFFDSTARWLKESPEHQFSLVIDELHTYRGTAGTEVALLLRNLTHRLGIEPGSDQLRILAASASLDPARDLGYVQDFFGVDQETFTFLPGQTIKPEKIQADISSAAPALASTADAAAAVSAAEDHGAHIALASAFFLNGQHGDGPEAKSENDLRQLLFPGAAPPDAEAALARLLEACEQAGSRPGWPRLRSHLFFRNVPGVWACTDPECALVQRPHPGRTVGKLFGEPATRCECQARVLELLYCQNCGDVMLGGFVTENITQNARVKAQLLADVPDLARLPDQARLDRTAGNYLFYWPRAQAPEVESLSWTADHGNVQYAFEEAVFEPATGALDRPKPGQQPTGWLFHVQAKKVKGTAARDPFSLEPFPTICPNCGDDWEIRYGDGKQLPHTDARRQRSPIRGMRTGFEKINQVLITELASQLPDDQRKLIVFTDSRQDAAKLSAGLDLRHYQDLLRILLYEHADSPPADDLARAEVCETGGVRSPENRAAVKRLRERDRSAFDRLSDLWKGDPEDFDGERAALESALSGQPSLKAISSLVAKQLIAMGINPGGPAASLSATEPTKTDKAERWSAAFDWSGKTPRPLAILSPPLERLLQKSYEGLSSEIIQGLFSGAGRDFESLGLGWLALTGAGQPPGTDPASPAAIGRASLRVLADLRRFSGLRDARDTPPPKLRLYWEAIAKHLSLPDDDVAQRAKTFWGPAVVDYVINPDKVVLQPAGEHGWVCGNCRRQHLHRGAGVCTRCRRPLPAEPVRVERLEDYYAWKAVEQLGKFRMHCAELTGQTDRADAQSRQARFQNVFLDTTSEEHPVPDAVDLLSVTTTMEAGVDIGALEAVVLGNMPPSRFNYQQRVGRAGRRNSPLAVALTVCRGRSHDEYYFERPHLITNEPTPKPYIALDQKEIFIRTLRSEVLRMAFSELRPNLSSLKLDFTNNVHGQFGKAGDWGILKPFIEKWIGTHPGEIADAAAALTRYAPAELREANWPSWVMANLPPDVSEVASDSIGHDDLSQRLAEAGKLPMFGFPTRVRHLYLRRPRSRYPWPPRNAIDRDLAMAVSQFAPLSEVVRDGRVYPVVGVASFKPAGTTPVPDPDPLGLERLMAVCRACSYISKLDTPSADPGPCPRCSAQPGIYAEVPLREPLGFRAGYHKDFDGNFSWSARAMSAKALTNLDDLSQAPQPAMRAYSGPGTRYVINDNSGRLFRFRRASPGTSTVNWGGWVSADAIERGKLPPAAAATGAPDVEVALGAVQPTDFLFIGPDKPVITSQGLRLNLITGSRQPGGAIDVNDGRRAAWYSLAFLMRTVAAVARLDVQELELSAGIYSGMIDGEPATMAFLADTLENGAGFCTHLGEPPEFAKLLDAAGTYISDLKSGNHARECNASCYRCLRDYSNMAYHALLDWRLAADLLDILNGGTLAPGGEREHGLLAKWASAYGGEMLAGTSAPVALLRDHLLYGTSAIIARHPLEAAEQTLIAERLAAAAAEAEVAVPGLETVVFTDTFTLDRNPGHVFDLLTDAGQA